ncbi:MAG: DUF485 domain-containing protein [Firmicutes bacterium HGW-Firmicutes-12]|nr:MAG: DUF485 domain-containing protein [Firmicutes bacterium HGW-Firmicutes-12]
MHEPSKEWKKDDASSIKELLGLWLFLLYCLVYIGFITINVVSPKFMAIDVGSFNVAITYGLGLIVLAMVLAFAYNHVSTHAEELLNNNQGRDGETE